MTTVEEALTHDGPLLAVWDDSTTPETLFVYDIASGRPERLAFTRDAALDKAGLTASLRSRGVMVGAAHGSELVWVEDDGFLVWSRAGVVAEGHALGLWLADGRTLRKPDVVRVISFFDEDAPGHRGVEVELKDGTSAVVVEEHDPAAELDPTYNLENVMIDAAWATFLGRALAGWLGVPHTDEVP
jgi:hypothetical protein